ncbi:hypothetical protein RIF29_35775 [Crotalaria pallida]|uniref:Uncharacterized protein n=1 Tax=Crotalaria pallida TaxID=3830 RepID=A0AAN9HU77_CROPI
MVPCIDTLSLRKKTNDLPPPLSLSLSIDSLSLILSSARRPQPWFAAAATSSRSHLLYLSHSHHYTDENRGGHRYQPLRLPLQFTPLPSVNIEDRYREDNILV